MPGSLPHGKCTYTTRVHTHMYTHTHAHTHTHTHHKHTCTDAHTRTCRPSKQKKLQETRHVWPKILIVL